VSAAKLRNIGPKSMAWLRQTGVGGGGDTKPHGEPAAGVRLPLGCGNSATAASAATTSSERRASGMSCQWQSRIAPSSAYRRLRLGRKPARLTRT
jgi:hypothetical protein